MRMRGSSRWLRWSVVGALAFTLTLSGCKKSKGSSAANDAVSAEPASVATIDGMYSYMAEAGVFEDCATGQRWPVAAEGENAELERAYLSSRAEPGSPLLVTVDGRVEPRRKIDGMGKENVLVVERFLLTRPGETCGRMTPIALENVRWSLLELNDQPIVVASDGTAPYLEINASKKSAYGFGGCNRFFGSYEGGKTQALTFREIGATRMACREGLNQEQALLTALGQTTRYEIRGSKLLLYADGAVVARFQARALLKTD